MTPHDSGWREVVLAGKVDAAILLLNAAMKEKLPAEDAARLRLLTSDESRDAELTQAKHQLQQLQAENRENKARLRHTQLQLQQAKEQLEQAKGAPEKPTAQVGPPNESSPPPAVTCPLSYEKWIMDPRCSWEEFEKYWGIGESDSDPSPDAPSTSRSTK